MGLKPDGTLDTSQTDKKRNAVIAWYTENEGQAPTEDEITSILANPSQWGYTPAAGGGTTTPVESYKEELRTRIAEKYGKTAADLLLRNMATAFSSVNGFAVDEQDDVLVGIKTYEADYVNEAREEERVLRHRKYEGLIRESLAESGIDGSPLPQDKVTASAIDRQIGKMLSDYERQYQSAIDLGYVPDDAFMADVLDEQAAGLMETARPDLNRNNPVYTDTKRRLQVGTAAVGAVAREVAAQEKAAQEAADFDTEVDALTSILSEEEFDALGGRTSRDYLEKAGGNVSTARKLMQADIRRARGEVGAKADAANFGAELDSQLALLTDAESAAFGDVTAKDFLDKAGGDIATARRLMNNAIRGAKNTVGTAEKEAKRKQDLLRFKLKTGVNDTFESPEAKEKLKDETFLEGVFKESETTGETADEVLKRILDPGEKKYAAEQQGYVDTIGAAGANPGFRDTEAAEIIASTTKDAALAMQYMRDGKTNLQDILRLTGGDLKTAAGAVGKRTEDLAYMAANPESDDPVAMAADLEKRKAESARQDAINAAAEAKKPKPPVAPAVMAPALPSRRR